MDWTVLLQFVRPELLILAVMLYVLGKFLKLNPRFKKEWTIPYILLGIAIILTPLYVIIVVGEGATASIILSGVIQGILIAGLTVFANELIKQVTEKR